MWLIVSSLLPHNLTISCFAASYLFLLSYDWYFWLCFCAVFRSDPVSVLRFPFFIHVYVFSCAMLLISRLKRPLSCFSSNFCFLVIVVLLILVFLVLFLLAVVSLSPCFSMQSISRCIYASTLSLMLSSPFSAFFSWHIQSVDVISGMLMPYVWSLVFLFSALLQ